MMRIMNYTSLQVREENKISIDERRRCPTVVICYIYSIHDLFVCNIVRVNSAWPDACHILFSIKLNIKKFPERLSLVPSSQNLMVSILLPDCFYFRMIRAFNLNAPLSIMFCVPAVNILIKGDVLFSAHSRLTRCRW